MKIYVVVRIGDDSGNPDRIVNAFVSLIEAQTEYPEVEEYEIVPINLNL